MLSRKTGMTFLLVAAFGGVGTFGCQHEVSRNDVEKKREQARESEQKAIVAENRAVADRREADQLALKANAQESKNDFVTEMQSKLLVVDGRIKDLDNRRAAESDSARKNEWNARIKQLEQERTAVDKKVSNLKSSSATDWVADRASVVTAWNEFTDHLTQAERDLTHR